MTKDNDKVIEQEHEQCCEKIYLQSSLTDIDQPKLLFGYEGANKLTWVHGEACGDSTD